MMQITEETEVIDKLFRPEVNILSCCIVYNVQLGMSSFTAYSGVLVKANNANFSCQLLLLFCGRFERSGVQASCRAPNSMNQTR